MRTGIIVNLNTIEGAVPAGKMIHAILANYATHKHSKVRACLCHPPASDVPFHADLGFLAQCCGRLLCQADAAPPQARRIPLGCPDNRFVEETKANGKALRLGPLIR
jgi:hypothetical protein